ncbi:MAG: class II aldolase/adducin family protein [Dehalococcoidales bacterium]|nr:class II aldolase/adducin family protein [Dehalococcoidales bacterium]
MEEDAAVRFEVNLLRESLPDDAGISRLIRWGRRFDELGLAPATTGNLSFRTDGGFVISGTGVSLGAIAREDLVEVLKAEVRGDRILVTARGRVSPSRESLLHLRIYDLRPDVRAVFHVHDTLVVDLAVAMGLPTTRKERPGGSQELAKEVNEFLRQHEWLNYFVLRNHGVVALGETMDEAGKLVESAHDLARKRRPH